MFWFKSIDSKKKNDVTTQGSHAGGNSFLLMGVPAF